MGAIDINVIIAFVSLTLYSAYLVGKAGKNAKEAWESAEKFRQMYHDENKAHEATKAELEQYKHHQETSQIFKPFPMKQVKISTSGSSCGEKAILSIVGDFDLEVGDRFICEIPTNDKYIRAIGYVNEDCTYILPNNPLDTIPMLIDHEAFIYKA